MPSGKRTIMKTPLRMEIVIRALSIEAGNAKCRIPASILKGL
jgi:hypothetical protein